MTIEDLPMENEENKDIKTKTLKTLSFLKT
jgi:hypothetical protein